MTTRLHDMKVEEISLVRRAANKKRFVLVKADGTEVDADLDLVPKEGGGFSLVPTGQAAGGNDPHPIKIPRDVHKSLLEGATGALERLVNVAKLIQGAEVVDSGDIPADVLVEMAAVADVLEKAARKQRGCACGYKGEPGEDGKCPKCGEKMGVPAPMVPASKAASAHAQLFAERTAALKRIADELESKGSDMDAETRSAKLRELHSIAYGMDDLASVVAVSKSDDELDKMISEAEARGEIRGMGAAVAEALKMLPAGVPPATPPANAAINAGSGHVPDPGGYPIQVGADFLAKVPGLDVLMKSVDKLKADLAEAQQRAAEAQQQAEAASEEAAAARRAVGMPTSGQPAGASTSRGFNGWERDMNRPQRD